MVADWVEIHFPNLSVGFTFEILGHFLFFVVYFPVRKVLFVIRNYVVGVEEVGVGNLGLELGLTWVYGGSGEDLLVIRVIGIISRFEWVTLGA